MHENSKKEYNISSYFYSEIMNSFQMDFSLYEDLISILKPESVLELGCGMGRLFPIFLKEAKTVTGVDVSDEMLRKGREYFKTHPYNSATVEFFNADMCTFKSDRKYDLIVFSLSVLKHLNDDEARIKALENSKNLLSDNGFMIFDHTALLYASSPTDWIDSKQSIVKSWMPDPSVLDGYQWKKTIHGDLDILEWRYLDAEQVLFESKFTTYRYDIETLLQHLDRLNLRHELILTEWGINGLDQQGKRFIGSASHPENQGSPKMALIERVKQRHERLWSNHEIYTKSLSD